MVKKSLLLLVVLLFGSMSLLRAQERVVYSFEGDLQGWTVIDADGDGFNWDLCSIIQAGYTIPSHSGEDCITSESYDSNTGDPLTPDNYIVSPQGQYASISFWACAQDPSYAAEHFGVAVSTTSNTSAAAFTTIDEWTMTAKSNGTSGNYASRSRAGREGEWYQYSVDLSAYEGQDIYVAIRHFDCTDMFMLNVDDVTLAVPDNSIVIDFETGDFSQYEFTNSTTYPWTVVEEGGTHYAKSGNGGVNSSESTLSCTHVFTTNGYIYFDFAAYGEGSDGYDWDKCRFYIDGNMMFDYGNHDMWESILQTVTAGSHTFAWTYKKDSSVNPTGDYFAIDNITFAEGDPCVAPNTVSSTTQPGGATITWGGYAAVYTLEYKLTAGSTWTSVANITANTYTISGLEAGDYDVRIQADCDPGNYATGSFSVMAAPTSTANWYGYVAYGSSFSDVFATFSMQDISNVTSVSAPGQDVYAAEYANNYVWFIGQGDGALYKASIDNEAHYIATPMQVVSGMESETATEMSYNQVDHMMYYVSAGDDASMLKKFDPANPAAGATTIGTLEEHLYAFAISPDGVAYGIRNTGDLYTVNLTTAAQTYVGSTGVTCSYVQTMAFDPETGELFWAQILDGSTYGLYKVDPATASALRLGELGAGVIEVTGLFGVYGSTVGTTIDDVMLEGFVAPQYNGHPNFNVTAPASAHYSVQSVSWYNNGTAMTSSDTFNDESANYYMVVNVTPESGYEFANNVNVYINGNASYAANSTVSGGVLQVQTINFNVVNATVYDFENSTFQGWTTIDADGDGYTWVLSSTGMGTGYGHNGSVDMVYSQSYDNNYGALTPDNYLVSPAKAAYNHISFFACAQDAAWASEHFGVAVSLTGNTSGSDFVTIDEWTMTAKRSGVKGVGRDGETRDQGNWYEITTDLSAYAGQEFWIAIRHFNCTDWFYLDVDDISLGIGDAVIENTADYMSIYPNPAKDKVVVTSDVTVNEYRVYDVTGAEVMSNKVNSDTFEVNVDNLTAGVYYLRIYADGLVQSKKFVVE